MKADAEAVVDGMTRRQRQQYRLLDHKLDRQPLPISGNAYHMLSERTLRPNVYARLGKISVERGESYWRWTALGKRVWFVIDTTAACSE
jgi:hypothetical protein